MNVIDLSRYFYEVSSEGLVVKKKMLPTGGIFFLKYFAVYLPAIGTAIFVFVDLDKILSNMPWNLCAWLLCCFFTFYEKKRHCSLGIPLMPPHSVS